LKLDNI